MDSWDLYFQFGEAMAELADKCSPEMDHDELRAKLPRPDYHWMHIWNICGLAENCGYFVHAFHSFRDVAEYVAAAFQHFGFPETAAIVFPSIEWGERLDEEEGDTTALHAECDALEKRVDFSYDALIDHLRANRSLYSVDIAEFEE